MTQRPCLELVVTAHCSRCDDALDWLLGAAELRGATLRTREVLSDDALYRRYAERVPVLRLGDAEVDWPFGAGELRRLLRQL